MRVVAVEDDLGVELVVQRRQLREGRRPRAPAGAVRSPSTAASPASRSTIATGCDRRRGLEHRQPLDQLVGPGGVVREVGDDGDLGFTPEILVGPGGRPGTAPPTSAGGSIFPALAPLSVTKLWRCP